MEYLAHCYSQLECTRIRRYAGAVHQDFLPNRIDENTVTALVSGRYHLVLGAGFDMQCTDSSGSRLPNADGLRREILDCCEDHAGAQDEVSLSRAYSRAKARDPETLVRLLKGRFCDVTPPEWFGSIFLIPWKRIWTLNVSDSLSVAFQQSKPNHKLDKLRIFNYDQPFEEVTPDVTAVTCLHGYAQNVDLRTGEPSLIFSLAEYNQLISANSVWFQTFKDAFSTEPFIVIGARLVDEPDLAGALQEGNHSHQTHGVPSYFISRSVSTADKEDIERAGFNVVTSTAEQFVERIVNEAGQVSALNASPAHLNLRDHDHRQLISQFSLVPRLPATAANQSPPDTSASHDFYSGHEPLWEDIKADRDALLPLTVKLEQTCRDHLVNGSGVRVFSVTGAPFSGKTTSTMRVVYNLAANFECWSFNQNQKLNPASTVKALQRRGPIILLFEDMAEFADDIGKLAENAKSRTEPILIIGTERKSRARRIEVAIDPEFLIGDFSLDRLTKDGALKLHQKRKSVGRAGKLTRTSDNGAISHYMNTHKGNLFEALHFLENAEGFESRVRNLTEKIPDSHRTLVGVTSLCDAAGVAPSIGVTCSIAKEKPGNVLHDITERSELGDFLRIMNGRISSHQHIFAENYLELVGKEEIASLATQIATTLAPQISTHSARNQTRNHRLVARVMRWRFLETYLSPVEADDWFYEQVKQCYGWNARFWEQRSLCATDSCRWDLAESFAEKSVSIVDDAMTLNTLSTVLFRRALVIDGDRRDMYIRRAINAAEASSDKRWKTEHPFVTFHKYLVAIGQKMRDENKPVPPWLITEWNKWLIRTENAGINGNDFNSEMTRYKEQWLRLAI